MLFDIFSKIVDVSYTNDCQAERIRLVARLQGELDPLQSLMCARFSTFGTLTENYVWKLRESRSILKQDTRTDMSHTINKGRI